MPMPKPLGNIVHLRRTPEYGGQWLSAPVAKSADSVRERVGRHVATSLPGASAAGIGLSVSDPYRLLAPDQLWLVYARTPDVRAAIDGIARQVSTWAWTLEVEGYNVSDPEFSGAQDAAETATRFLRAPNGNGETWQEVLTQVVTDLLVFDQGVIEEVYDTLVDAPLPGESQVTMKVPASNATLEELVALNGASIEGIRDEFGRLFGYRQDVYGTLGPLSSGGRIGSTAATAPVFSREQIVTFTLFPNTSGRSAPLIETIVNEVITILRASEHSMLAMDADEIPPGILVLTGVAGKAAEQAKTDIQRLKGKDHKIRVITNPDPRGSGAHWVELRRTPKDLSMIEVVREVRRTIWRVFGVLPVEMGDSQDMPRAVGQVQLDVSTSHLVEPILDLVEAKFNARVVPVLVGDEYAGMVVLRFDREAKLSPAEQRDKAAAMVSLVREGILSRNEARVEIDQEPQEGGDVLTITTSGGLVRVDTLGLVAGPVRPGRGTGGATSGDGGGGEEEAPGEIEGEEPVDSAPGEASDEGLEPSGRRRLGTLGQTGMKDVIEAEKKRLTRSRAHDRACGCGACSDTRSTDLPSDWPEASKFKGYRTVALGPLADSVSAYTRAVQPLYDEAMDEVLAAVGAEYDQTMRPEEAQRAVAALDRALAKLAVRWSVSTAPLYERVAKSSRDSATDFAGVPVVENWRALGAAYGSRAMVYLTEPGGLLSDVRASVIAIIGAATAEPAARAVKAVPDGIAPGADESDLLAAIASVFVSQRNRIENWSGRLVELASEVLSGGMAEGSAEAGEWFYEWVAVGDGEMCVTCSTEGRQGFRPASQMQVHPGGSTRCRARCRCVIVYWTRAEVQSGSAVSLSGNAPRI